MNERNYSDQAMENVYPPYKDLSPEDRKVVDKRFGDLWIAAGEVPDTPPQGKPKEIGSGSSIFDAVLLGVQGASRASRVVVDFGLRRLEAATQRAADRANQRSLMRMYRESLKDLEPKR
jgi:hypothetical protein